MKFDTMKVEHYLSLHSLMILQSRSLRYIGISPNLLFSSLDTKRMMSIASLSIYSGVNFSSMGLFIDVKCCRKDLNPYPIVYNSIALPLSYGSQGMVIFGMFLKDFSEELFFGNKGRCSNFKGQSFKRFFMQSSQRLMLTRKIG